MNQSILVVGAGGHARAVVRTLISANWLVEGILAQNPIILGERIGPARVVGGVQDLATWLERGIRYAFAAIGDNGLRLQISDHIKTTGLIMPSLRHQLAKIEEGVVVGSGSIVCLGALVCAEAEIGEGAIINSGAIVEHETKVGAYSHIAPGCMLAGRVRVGDGSFLGIGTVVKEKVTIGDGVTVGAGSVVLDDLPSGVTAYGIPARIAKS